MSNQNFLMVQQYRKHLFKSYNLQKALIEKSFLEIM